jgi:hypothetical protein
MGAGAQGLAVSRSYGAHVEWQPCGHADGGGFCGDRMCITTPEQEDRSLALAPFLMLA